MLKKITYILFLILALILSSIFFLSNFGLKTERFNRNISDQLKKNYPNINVNFSEIKLLLNPFDLSLNLETKNPKVFFEKTFSEKVNREVSARSSRAAGTPWMMDACADENASNTRRRRRNNRENLSRIVAGSNFETAIDDFYCYCLRCCYCRCCRRLLYSYLLSDSSLRFCCSR